MPLCGARAEDPNRYLKSLRNKRKNDRKSSAKRARENGRSRKTRELDVMRVWFLRAFVVFFLDFVLFSQSFHGYSLDMFLCSCFLNKTNFPCLKKPLDPTLPFLAHKHSHCFKGSTFWASPSTFFMKWREDHYLETQCAHHAQQKLRNLLSSTGPG